MKTNFLVRLGKSFFVWSQKHPVGKIPREVAREGAGENRIPFAHLANSVPVYLTLVKRLMSDSRKSLKILDVGCGAGRNISFVKEIVSREDSEFWGIDYSEACVNFAKSRYSEMGVKFIAHDGRKMPFKNNYFDYVVSSHVVEHIKRTEVATYFSEIARILKKDGIAVIGTPNRKYCQDLFSKNSNDCPKLRLILPHLHEYYYLELKNLLLAGKWFNQFKIDQTKNLVNRKLMINSINQIRPKKSLWGKAVHTVYSILRKNSKLQDLMAKWGTELVLRLMGASYFDLLSKTRYIEDNGEDEGDNFIIIAQK